MSCEYLACARGLFVTVGLAVVDKTLNDMVPQLIPRDPVNSDGVKAGFNLIRSNVQVHETVNVEIDPTNNAPIAVFDGRTPPARVGLRPAFSLS